MNGPSVNHNATACHGTHLINPCLELRLKTEGNGQKTPFLFPFLHFIIGNGVEIGTAGIGCGSGKYGCLEMDKLILWN